MAVSEVTPCPYRTPGTPKVRPLRFTQAPSLAPMTSCMINARARRRRGTGRRTNSGLALFRGLRIGPLRDYLQPNFSKNPARPSSPTRRFTFVWSQCKTFPKFGLRQKPGGMSRPTRQTPPASAHCPTGWPAKRDSLRILAQPSRLAAGLPRPVAPAGLRQGAGGDRVAF
jgi:hypothetical protein